MYFRKACQIFWFGLAVLILCVMAGAIRCGAEEAKPDVGAPAAWVVPILYNPAGKSDFTNSPLPLRWVLLDHQIAAVNNESFHHEILQVTTAAGVDPGSRISINYDPSYQLLTFHWIKIWRGTNGFNRLDPDKVQVVQSSLDPLLMLFSMEKTAVVTLDDVRPGDVIDYAYSLQGNSPLFAGFFSGRIDAQMSYPIERSVTRLIWPNGRNLYVQNHGTTVKYNATRKADSIEFTWDLKQIPAGRMEPSLPSWFEPYPWIQLSEFHTWGDVNRVALSVFTNGAALSPELAQKIAEWRKLPQRDGQVLAVLRFVQEEVRYIGIESGASGYKPATPSAVFARRFGDCKDKTFLFVTALRALGIDAWPVFVSTKYRRVVAELHPSATVFDHLITQVNLAGQTFWLDPTANYQRGPLSVRSWPNYGYGLVVRPGTVGLAVIPASPVRPKTTVTQYIHLGQLDGDSEMKVVRVAEGPDAEQWRAYFATMPRTDIEHTDLKNLARLYPDITQTAPMVYTDDDKLNRIEIDESYSIHKIWQRLPGEPFFHCQIFPENIQAAIQSPAMAARTMPLGIAYPVHQVYHGEITVPAIAALHPDDQSIENPAFRFHRSATIGTGLLFLDFDFQSLSDAVAAESVPEYARQLNAAGELLGYTISSD